MLASVVWAPKLAVQASRRTQSSPFLLSLTLALPLLGPLEELAFVMEYFSPKLPVHAKLEYACSQNSLTDFSQNILPLLCHRRSWRR